MDLCRTRLFRLASSLGVLFIAGLIWVFPGRAQEGVDEGELELGAKLYSENCAVCHGGDGQGRVGATLAKDWPSIRPDLQVQEIITNGIPGSPMVAWSQENGGPLSGDEIDALVYYILSWETGGPTRIYPTSTPITLPIIGSVEILPMGPTSIYKIARCATAKVVRVGSELPWQEIGPPSGPICALNRSSSVE
jgi:mono/diheme cytochrome c family protein